jgi:predicted house-cleaning NTP pyrophosphatase (Maf/HAM1 superfamily)
MLSDGAASAGKKGTGGHCSSKIRKCHQMVLLQQGRKKQVITAVVVKYRKRHQMMLHQERKEQVITTAVRIRKASRWYWHQLGNKEPVVTAAVEK